ncbi:hypothetical protein E2562_013043 [Oryza meyeriana var. granulata]|uniref:Uncharacterized protein n=1 Tax=Oryza meyeriana var. granulata TaxID=110450 RepID=A0A6G1DK90_9ORYZ|nr:hypothetical protein E2562_013043 [Oryza meyeriana var. granulata]
MSTEEAAAEEAAATTEVKVVAAKRKAKDGSATTAFSAVGHGHIRAAATHPFSRGNGSAAATRIPIGRGHIPAATTSINFPAASTRVHTGCGSVVASGVADAPPIDGRQGYTAMRSPDGGIKTHKVVS